MTPAKHFLRDYNDRVRSDNAKMQGADHQAIIEELAPLHDLTVSEAAELVLGQAAMPVSG